MLNRKSTNEQIWADETARTILEAGQLILMDKVITKNPEYTSLFLAGMVEVQSSNSSTLSAAKRMMLGWDDKRTYIARSIINAKTTIADQLKLGNALDFRLKVVDTNLPQFDGHEPREDRDGVVLVDEKGDKVYRSYDVVTAEELEATGHETIPCHKPKQDKAPVISAAQLQAAGTF